MVKRYLTPVRVIPTTYLNTRSLSQSNYTISPSLIMPIKGLRQYWDWIFQGRSWYFFHLSCLQSFALTIHTASLHLFHVSVYSASMYWILLWAGHHDRRSTFRGETGYLSCFQGVYSIVGNHYNKQETAVRERSKSHGRVSPGLHDIQGQTPSSVLRPVNQCDQEVK